MTTISKRGAPGSESTPAPVAMTTPDGPGPGAAADLVCSRNSVTVHVAGRRVELPPTEQLAFLAGIGLLAALEIIEWPVGLTIAIGHEIARNRHSRVLREFGEALEEA
ncbi:hypothetical protein ACFZAR_41675 [Streptomyces sp. NPDC008222]|uniref:hypothetical protein n=1 Tax=Streptomyces sp. NPDC008222 TaxID=3364820 RepID=UPI0036E5EF89